ncbi:MAG TPA: hypothetical protein HPP87_11090, partial [Planctomycetes bacterium]|nr:hypothetical protein [Planctomycetota bacterium]
QTPGNYKRTANATTAAERTPQCAATINNNNKHKDIQAEREKALSKFQRPSADEVSKYAESIGFELDGSRFVDFYEAKGWMVGKNRMRNWRAAVRTWKARSAKEAGYAQYQKPAGGSARRRDYTPEPVAEGVTVLNV